MPTKLLRSSWIPGPDHDQPGPVLVSITDFHLNTATDLPAAHRAARRLATNWPNLQGAYGMWLWARPFTRHCGAVAIWRNEAALQGFVGWGPHAEIMRRYRGRGALTSSTWHAEVFDRVGIWGRARSRLLA
ncbi:hypothetical protein [Streptomyces sp. HNM0574]|uniref:hypothetical protein n=1 Tax=Streptomyces sp. HNM0574 TaxID=2714954 RepID=UPI00146BF595|nr:hypothetical protein [Streptomyces sp. HNM0574]NLU70450.1 hypothetical protein [Streptomyces sp. HNM0574]